jgi:hypothetical protein
MKDDKIKIQEAWAVQVVRTRKVIYDTIRDKKRDVGPGYLYHIGLGNCKIVKIKIIAEPSL